MAQVGKTKSDLKYTEEWCADFVCDCAQLAKPNFPFSGNCDTLLSMLKTRGGKWYSYNSSYQPQKGDIVFYSKYLNKSNDSTHVGIIYKSGINSDNTINAVEGNTSGVTQSCVNTKQRYITRGLFVMGYISFFDGNASSNGDVDNGKYNDFDINDPETYTEPDRIISLKDPMMRGSDVAWVQYMLKKSGYEITVDGIFGKDSDAVTRKYQSDNELTVDGMVGEKTIAKLKTTANISLETPEPTESPEPIESPEPTETPEKIKGDADMNGIVEAADATLILRYVAELEMLSDEQLAAADMNDDDIVDSSDATQVLIAVVS